MTTITSTDRRQRYASDIRTDVVFTALSSPVRRQILHILAGAPDYSLYTQNVTDTLNEDQDSDLAQSTVSHHIRNLRDAGLVEEQYRGAFTYYRFCFEPLFQAQAYLDTLKGTANG
jgi:DNA-binding transcriptional ArsR family regulator